MRASIPVGSTDQRLRRNFKPRYSFARIIAPPIDVVAIARHHRFDRRVRRPIGQREDHPCAPHVSA
jgi:hypothetical protein